MAFETKYFCDTCNDVFYRTTEHDPRKTKGRTPSCPKCKTNNAIEKDRMKISGDFKIQTSDEIKQANDTRINEVISARQAPSMGKSAFTVAMDETAKMVMQDYGLTNLRDNLRPGDNMVMPLSGKDENGTSLETRVDQVFAPQKNNVMGVAGNKLNSSITNSINQGAFRGYGDVVQKQKDSGIRPNITYVGDYQERPNVNTKQ